MKRILLGVVAGLMVASCSKNETVSLNQDEIQFSVVTNKAAKAADLYCNNNLPGAFNVWASYKKDANSTAATYFAGDEIKHVNSAWQNQSGNRYWPEIGTLNFYAHVNAGQFNWTVDAPTIDFEVAAKAEDQKDLLYAVATDKSRQTAAVELNFRHALSQIVFKAKNTNPKLHVVIEGVKVCNVKNAGQFAFSTSTATNVENHNQINSLPNEGLGTWTLEDGKTSYEVSFDGVVATSQAVSLTGKYSDTENFTGDNNTLLLLPQATNAWVPSANNKYGQETANTYFLVKCRIYNVAGTSYQEGDVMLWGVTDDAGKDVGDYAAIPVAFNWEQGKKYIYTFVFGDGNGGYDDDSDPVLFPITFDVTVDDFADATDTNVSMGTN